MLQSCQSYPIDKIIAVDGKYEGYPDKADLSTKECRDLFKAFQTPYVIVDAPNLPQPQKRQVYFDQAQKHSLDIIIVVDTDEYFLSARTDWPLFIDNLRQQIANHAHTWRQAYCIPTYLTHKGTQKMPDSYVENLPRIFHQPWKLTYVEDHYSIRNKTTGVLMTFEGNPVIEGIALGHDHDLRTKKYNANTKMYEEQLIELENKQRDQKRIEFSDSLYKQNHNPKA
jgi:hypothetical protein